MKKYGYLNKKRFPASPAEEQIVYGIARVNNNNVKANEEIIVFLAILIVEIFICTTLLCIFR